MAVDGEDRLTLIGVDDVDEAILQSCDELGSVVLALLGDSDGVIVDTLGDADDIQLVPDAVGTAHALLAGLILLIGGEHPAGFVVVTAVSVADDDVDLLSSSVGESGAVAGVKRNDVGEVGDLLAVVVFHQPHGGVDVTGGGRGLLNCPLCLVEVFPGELFTGCDLGCQFLAVLGRSCVDQGAVVGDLRTVLLGGVFFAVPGGGVGAVVGQAVAGSGEDDVDVIGVESVGAAGEPAEVDRACGHSLAGSIVAGADGDVNFVDVIAEVCHLSLDELGQILGAGDDNVGVLGRNELESQLVEVGPCGLSIGNGLSSGCFSSSGSRRLTAGAEGEHHNKCEKQCYGLFHFLFSSIKFIFMAKGR